MERPVLRRPPSVQNSHYRGGAVGVGTAAWILHRLSGVVLVIYLMMHIIVIGQSVRNQDAFNAALHFVQQPPFVILDCALAGTVAYHALNGLRLVSFDLGWGIRAQKPLFFVSLILAFAVFVVSLVAAHSLLCCKESPPWPSLSAVRASPPHVAAAWSIRTSGPGCCNASPAWCWWC